MNGESTYQIGEQLGRSANWVRAVLTDLDIPRRGPGNPNTPHREVVSYDGYHKRVRAARGMPKRCEVCGTTSARTYHWANLTGRYEDIADYMRMCVPCHRDYDYTRAGKSRK